MKHAGEHHSNSKGFQFWQQHNHPVELWSDEVFYQKLNYIQMNPVKAGFVLQPEDWMYSSTLDYAGRRGLVELAVLYPRAKGAAPAEFFKHKLSLDPLSNITFNLP